MPELPEVETMRRGILGIVGSRIAGVERARCRRRPIAIEPALNRFRRTAVGATIAGIGRIGKRVVVQLDRDAAIVFEPRMTGLVLLTEPPTLEHLRLRIKLDAGPAKELLYWDRRGLGSVRLLSNAELADRFDESTLGPDALAISAEQLAERLGASRRAIKVALLDQRAVAGIGNLYAAEILHRAGIHPARRCDRLKATHWRQLQSAIVEILQTAIRFEGSTLGDGTYRNALNQSGGYQNHHRVYDRAGEPCVNCGAGRIERIVQAQRATFFCPKCQPRRQNA
ncbi:MAG TPA: bifunctional DNA-formamidopyrimidine glycosylase/DNA-(apurinic or apyrimidinic site) lyase [Pirellulales bacterium]|jgi:formamidopyrimidine-DNA glycosylase|nr:bifunctional DNA-formamidopyrimidine glycosylase/DNA-(apurinic or apyrimidinic site) lyase [Pirellulales bacterium]